MYPYLEEGVEKLKRRLIKMGSLVEEQIKNTVTALFEGNTELAEMVIAQDEKVDKYEVKIDKQCQKIIALTQPVAFDLRLILSAISINRDLERMGDSAVNIAKLVDRIKEHKDFLFDIELNKMSEQTLLNVKNSLDSFINGDYKLAFEVIRADEIVDRFDDELVRVVIDKMLNDKNLIVAGTHVINVIRNLERLSDHATNIAEEIIFLIDSKIVKHKKDISESEVINDSPEDISE
jgi:phosphate transport system protein